MTTVSKPIERRFITAVDLRAAEDDPENDEKAGTHLVGHAAVFNQRVMIGDRRWGFVEEILPKAFRDVLKSKQDVRYLFNHDPNQLLGRTAADTLALEEDKDGLLSDVELPDTQLARDLATLVDRRDVSQMSFAFIPGEVRWSTLSDDDEAFPGMELRQIASVERLYDVSAVTYPAYDTTDLALRTAGLALDVKEHLGHRGTVTSMRGRHLKNRHNAATWRARTWT